jgi:hypothetical protein
MHSISFGDEARRSWRGSVAKDSNTAFSGLERGVKNTTECFGLEAKPSMIELSPAESRYELLATANPFGVGDAEETAGI